MSIKNNLWCQANAKQNVLCSRLIRAFLSTVLVRVSRFRGDSLTHKSLKMRQKKLVHPTRFELVASAFGGQPPCVGVHPQPPVKPLFIVQLGC